MSGKSNGFELAMLIGELPYGSKILIAQNLNCSPSKISMALRGLVRDKHFLGRLQAEAQKIKVQCDAELAV